MDPNQNMANATVDNPNIRQVHCSVQFLVKTGENLNFRNSSSLLTYGSFCPLLGVRLSITV